MASPGKMEGASLRGWAGEAEWCGEPGAAGSGVENRGLEVWDPAGDPRWPGGWWGRDSDRLGQGRRDRNIHVGTSRGQSLERARPGPPGGAGGDPELATGLGNSGGGGGVGRCTSQTRRGDLKAAVAPQPPADEGETQKGSLLHPVLLNWVRSGFGQGVKRIRME